MLLRGDGEIDSMTDGQCERCGGAVDQAGACHTCDSDMATAMPRPEPSPAPMAGSAFESHPWVTAPSSESTRSDAVRRFGWDPSTDEVLAPLPAAAPVPEPEPPSTVAETALPAPELEALFAALEASPIRIKPQEPEPPAAPTPSMAEDSDADSGFGRIVAQAPPISLPFARPFELEPVAPSATEEAERPSDTMVPSTAAQPTIALRRTFDFDAPVVPETAHVIEHDHIGTDAPIVAPHEIRDVPSLEEILAASQEVHGAIEQPLPEAPIASIAVKAPAPIDTPAIASTPAAAETVRAIDLPMPIAPPADTALPAPEVRLPPPLAAPAPIAQPTVMAQSSAQAAPSIRWRPLLTAGATLVILAVIGVPLSKLWRERGAAQPVVQPAPAASRPAPTRAPAARATAPASAPAAPVASPSPVSRATAPSAAVTVSTASNTMVAAVPRPSAAARPNPPLLSPDAQVPPRPARPMPSPAPTPQPAPAPQVAALAPDITAPSVAALPAATAEPEPPPAPIAAATTPAAGPFFELNDVDRPPKVTTRTDTELPAALEGHAIHEIVVVRVLVSQTGHPALVSLLRHSKTGLALDEAVIAAVKQWTFTPATKRGQSVSCFYHVAVTVSQN